jgi:hypothetical protein
MPGDFKEKGWEFWLGAAFITAAVAVLVPAFLFEPWHKIVSDLGASVAAFAVVGASLIAYSGAVAKVRFDRQVEQAKNATRRRNLFLKTHMAAAQLYEEASAADRKLRMDQQSIVTKPSVVTAQFRIREPEGLQEAWSALDQIPVECVSALRGIRLHFGRLTRLLDSLDQNPLFQNRAEGGGRLDIGSELLAIVKYAKQILEILQPSVLEYAPPPTTTLAEKTSSSLHS